jgi:hypothetical protein
MLFDFRATYKTYSNEALAQIVANPSGYQPDAVTAARELLAARGITEEALHDMLYPPKVTATFAMPNVEYKDGQTNIFEEELTRPMSDQTRKRRVFIGIAWGGLQAIDLLQKCYSYYIRYRYSGSFSFPMTFLFLDLLLTALPALSLYLLFKRQKWGWKLATGLMCYRIAFLLQAVYHMFSVGAFYLFSIKWNTIIFWAVAAIYVVGLIFLINREFRNDFRISRKVMWQSMAGGGVAYLVFKLLMWSLDNLS